MSANVSAIPMRPNIKIKNIALPLEHGSWGFVFEPLIAGLLIAFSPSAIWITLLVVGAFLARQPLKVLLNDWIAKRNLPQTSVALKFVLIYGSISLFGAVGSLAFTKLDSFLPFLFVMPFAVYQIYCDASRKSREVLPELTGSIAVSSSIAVLALADNWTFPAAVTLWGIFIARLIPSILYVRNRLKLEKGKQFSQIIPFLANLVAFVFVAMLTYKGFASLITTAMFAVLLVRSTIGLSKYRSKIKAMRIGVWEVVYGTLTAISVVLGYYLGV